MYFEHEYTVKIKGNSTKAIIADIVDQIELGIYYQLGDDIEEMEIDVKDNSTLVKDRNVLNTFEKDPKRGVKIFLEMNARNGFTK